MQDAGFGNKYRTIGQRRYLGSKTKLLSFIDDILKQEAVSFSSFADLFAGTGVVAQAFRSRAHLIVNDILESNYLCYLAFFGSQPLRTSWLEQQLNAYNQLQPATLADNYFARHYAGTYFDADNARLIGHIRDDIEKRYQSDTISERERAYLITALIYALDRIANTVGHYDAYRRVAIPARRLELQPLLITPSRFKANIYRQDANTLASHIKADVVYLDPPYNSRQYSDAYHLLENIAGWEQKPVLGIAKKIDRSHIKSAYSLKAAGHAFSELINTIDARFILVSYNDMGTSGDARSQSRISDHELVSALERKGKVTVYEKSFNQFTTGRSSRHDLKERIFFCRVDASKKTPSTVLRSEHNTHRQAYVKSPLNYTGGKHKLLPQLSKYWPAKISTFYDVFCGAANVGINAPAEQIVCIDNNPQLIAVLRLMQATNFDELNQRILAVVNRYGLSQSYVHGYAHYGADSSTGLGSFNKQPYLALRQAYNEAPGKDKTLLLLVLILYGFNNQLRFNAKQEFNLPVGKRDYNGSSRHNLANFNAITANKPVSFKVGDFRELTATQFQPDDLIYLDPPYLLGLASYNESGGWSVKDEQDLHTTLSQLDKKGVRFALSNVVEHKGETNHLLLKWAATHHFNVHYLDHHYKNSNYQSTAKHGITREVLVTNYGEV